MAVNIEALIDDKRKAREIELNRKLIETIEGPQHHTRAGKVLRGIRIAAEIMILPYTFVRCINFITTGYTGFPRDNKLRSDGVPIQEAYQRLAAAGVLEKGLDAAAAEAGLVSITKSRGTFEVMYGEGWYDIKTIECVDGTRALKAIREVPLD